MLYPLLIAAIVLFVTHVVLLLMSFRGGALVNTRYFYSHFTLWLTGLCVFILALQYGGKGLSGFLDYFDSPVKLGIILLFTLALSLTAHLIVKKVVLPLLS